MNHLLSLLLTAILCASASAQTIKSLGYNTTNGSIVYTANQALVWTSSYGVIVSNEFVFRDPQGNSTAISGLGLTFGSTNTNPVATVFGFEDAGADVLRNIARANLGFSTNLNTLWTATNAINARSAIGIGSVVDYATGDSANSTVGATIDLASALWDSANDVAALKINDNEVNVANNTIVTNFRSALGLGLPALTNTSNVTMMRALSGSTNTNEPYSGSISVTGTNNTNTLVFSNGILQSVQ